MATRRKDWRWIDSSNENVGGKTLLPQMRQVLRVTKIGENNGADMRGKLAKKRLGGKAET